MDKETLIHLIATRIPNCVSDKIDREHLKKIVNLLNEIRKLEHLIVRRKYYQKRDFPSKKN